MTYWCGNEVSEKSKHSSRTVAHFKGGNLITTAIIIYKETIGFNNNNHSLGDDPLTPAKGSTSAREASPLGGRGLDQLTTHYPIPDLPPYAVRIPHIHGATAYGATIIW